MKKIIMSLIIFIMLLTTISFAETKAKVNVDAIRMRESASTDSKIVTNVYKDDEVEILEENGEWCKIKYGDNSGYTKTEFLTKINSTTQIEQNDNKSEYTQQNSESQPTENTTEESTENTNQENIIPEETVVQNVSVGENLFIPNTVKIRRIPNFTVTDEIEITQGTDVIIENILGNWCKISDGNNSGWILKNKFLQEQNPTTSVESDDIVETINNDEVNTEPVEEPELQNTITENVTQENTVTENDTVSKNAIVIVETARVRDSASTNGEIIGTLDEDQVVKITGEEGDFYKISTNSIDTGYVSKRLVKEKNVTSRSSNVERTAVVEVQDTVTEDANTQLTEIFSQENEVIEEQNANISRKNEVIEFAKQYLGYPYVLGASSPQTGFDCSGFTRYIFGHFGYTLGGTASSQTSLGAVVERENLQTADLLLFYDEGKTRIGHVGIYIGDGNFIHSANPKRGVVIDNLNTNSYYTQRFVTARRIVE